MRANEIESKEVKLQLAEMEKFLKECEKKEAELNEKAKQLD